jgi:hypothetical protein
MFFNRNDLKSLQDRVAKLESERIKSRWWNIAGGIASILGAGLAALTLLAILNQLSSLA